jgi:hypothetical protein
MEPAVVHNEELDSHGCGELRQLPLRLFVHIEPRRFPGCFVVEVMVPQLRRLPPGETAQAFEVRPTKLGFDEYDIASQGLVSHHYWIDGDRARMESYPGRYVWPAELDLMARLAGMTLRGRWGG